MKKTREYPFFSVMYSIAYLVLIYICASLVAEKLGYCELWQTTVIAVLMTACALFAFLIFRAAGVKYTVRKKRDQYIRKHPSYLVLDIMPIALIYLVTLLSRILWMNMNPLRVTGNEELFQNACVMQGTYADTGFNYHGITWIYKELLHGSCILLGNDAIAVYGLNLVIQVLTVFMGYLLLRNLVNRKAAMMFAVLCNVIPYFYETLSISDPAMLYMLLVLICLNVFVGLNKKADQIRNATGYILYVLSGILTGIMLFCDLFSLFLFLSGITMLLLADTVYAQKLKIRFIGYLSGWLVGVVLAVTIGALLLMNINHTDIFWDAVYDFATQNFDLYIQAFELMVWDHSSYTWNLWIVLMMFFSGIVAILQRKNEKEVLSLVTPIYIGVVFMLLCQIFIMDGIVITAVTLVVMIAAGFGMIFEMKHPLLEQKSPDAQTQSEIQIQPEIQTELQTETQPKIQFIENPLPLPKKHVRKEMDYQHEVTEEQMHYDVAVSDTDDFDI